MKHFSLLLVIGIAALVMHGISTRSGLLTESRDAGKNENSGYGNGPSSPRSKARSRILAEESDHAASGAMPSVGRNEASRENPELPSVAENPGGHTHEDAEEVPGLAVQLSEGFRLPAVIMAQGLASNDGRNEVTQQVKAASDEVVNRFYGEIACEVSDRSVQEEALPKDVGMEEDTVVVQPDAGTEQVRRAADELYRTLFGDEAYNRNMIHSAIEVTLPSPENH